MSTYKITEEPGADPTDIEAIHQGLQGYNDQFTGPVNYQPLTILVRDDQDNLVGGLVGGSYWRWLHVDTLWLDESIRKQGFGSQLLAQAEQVARDRSCVGVHLDTMSFQALPFYQHHGYTLYGQLDGMPPGHTRYSLQKRLDS